MGLAEQYTDPYIAAYRRVPPVGPGVCFVCHTGVNPGWPTCYSCDRTARQVTYPASSILPISLYEVPDQYWNVLRHYKDHESDTVRQTMSTILAATIARFVANHWACIRQMTSGEPTLVTTVPSTRGRAGTHPLVSVVSRVGQLAPLYSDLLVKGPGVIARVRAVDDGFLALRRLDGHRVLLVEDTFTSGARTQSAVSRLWLAGAASVGVLVAGRVVDPEWNDGCRAVWGYAKAPFSFGTCCLCANRVN